MRIVFASAEVSPVAKSGGLGDVCGSLPKALEQLGHEVVLFMPFYRQAGSWFAKSGAPLDQALPTVQISWGSWSHEATFLRSRLPGTEIPLYLVANDFFFNREHLYSARWDGNDDALERFAFFSRAVIRGCELLDIRPDVLHAHDWHTALLPVYLHSGLRGSEVFAKTRSVYTIHNLNYQGVTSHDHYDVLGLHSRYWAADALEHFGEINPMKAGIIFADQVTTVSPNYAREIQTHEHGAGLDGVLRSLSFKVNGILNGIDTAEWDPATDSHITAPYDRDDVEAKSESKKELVREAGLRFDPNAPVFGVVSRLVDQKGLQLLAPILPKLLAAGAQFVLLGSGDPQMEEFFSRFGEEHRNASRVWLGFDNELAHQIYAGCDVLLMPSIYEPCGLNQMYALRYGTVPLVRITGGLKDTVVPYDGTNLETATGFGFTGTDPAQLYQAAWIATLTYRDQATWKRLQRNGMAVDFSWERSARDYEFVYRRAMS